PVTDPEAYRYMRSYSPYENVDRRRYPAILATAGLNDPRVSYHEPAKWVARLRAASTGGAPGLLKTGMGAGAPGPSGRYDAWRDEALVLAFVLDQLGAASARGHYRCAWMRIAFFPGGGRRAVAARGNI